MESREFDILIKSVAKGDSDSLEKLYNACAKGIYALAYSIVKSHAMAEDIMQDTFVRVWSSASTFTSTGNGRAWIYRIARNLSLNAVTRRKTDSLDSIAEQTGNQIASDVSTEDTAVTGHSIDHALSLLSDNEREVITLHSMSGLTLNEIAELLGIPLGTVKWRHAQALKKLRNMLSDII